MRSKEYFDDEPFSRRNTIQEEKDLKQRYDNILKDLERAVPRQTEAEMKAKQGGLAGVAFSPEEGFRRPAESTGEPEKPVKRSDIVKLLNEKLNVPIRTGRFRGSGRGVLGIFKLKEEVIRTKMANDIETIAHEIGHGLQKFLWPETVNAKRGAAGMKAGPLEAFRDELDPLATQARAGQDPITEGFAEYIRHYVTNEAQARKVAPKFTEFLRKNWMQRVLNQKQFCMKLGSNLTDG